MLAGDFDRGICWTLALWVCIFDTGNEDPGTTDEKSLHNLTQQTCFSSLSTTIGCGQPHPGQLTWNLVFFFNKRSKLQQCFIQKFLTRFWTQANTLLGQKQTLKPTFALKTLMWLSLHFAVDNQPKYMFIEDSKSRRLCPHPIPLQTD